MAKASAGDKQRAIKVLAELSRSKDDRWVALRAKRLRDQLRLPMSEILKKVPGDSILKKAANCGISRQAYYAWINGISRPNPTQGKKLAKMTGLTVEQIRGREIYSPPRVNAAVPKPPRAPRAPRRVKSESDDLST